MYLCYTVAVKVANHGTVCSICNKTETDQHQDVSSNVVMIVNFCLIIKYVLNNH